MLVLIKTYYSPNVMMTTPMIGGLFQMKNFITWGRVTLPTVSVLSFTINPVHKKNFTMIEK
jgi:hypothetical protein